MRLSRTTELGAKPPEGINVDWRVQSQNSVVAGDDTTETDTYSGPQFKLNGIEGSS